MASPDASAFHGSASAARRVTRSLHSIGDDRRTDGRLSGLVLNMNGGIEVAECAPCAGSDLTLREKIMSMDDMVLVEENEDDSPATDDEESVA